MMSSRAAKRKRASSQGGRKPAQQEGSGKVAASAAKESSSALDIPLPLKRLIYKEQERIEQNRQLIQLPRDPNVNQILDDYLKTLPVEEGGDPAKPWDEVVEGVRHYFNKALGSVLLYGPERAQYNELRRKNRDAQMADIYGAEHLLRLFVKFPELLEKVEMEDSARILIREKMERFLVYMNEIRNALFTAHYKAVRTSAHTCCVTGCDLSTLQAGRRNK
jgi:mortality factor 4-like protein 1